MNVFKALNNNKPTSSVTIAANFIEVENPCRLIISTDSVDFNNITKHKNINIHNIPFTILNEYQEAITLYGVVSMSYSSNKIMRSRQITLDLAFHLDQEDLNRLIRMFKTRIDIQHYSFRQTYKH